MSLNRVRQSALFALILCSCAGSEIYPEARHANSLFDDIADCARGDERIPFQTKCRKKFENSEFNVRVDSIKTLGVTYFTLFAEMGDPNQLANCSLRGAKQRVLVDALHAGEITRLRATPSQVTFGDVNFIHFEECEIIDK